MTMKSDIFAARSIGAACAVAIDLATATGDATWTARAALLTPMAKSFGSDVGCQVADTGVQIHGGMGYAEESDVSRYFVDARVLSIFEGAEETLALKVIAKDLISNAAD